MLAPYYIGLPPIAFLEFGNRQIGHVLFCFQILQERLCDRVGTRIVHTGNPYSSQMLVLDGNVAGVACRTILRTTFQSQQHGFLSVQIRHLVTGGDTFLVYRRWGGVVVRVVRLVRRFRRQNKLDPAAKGWVRLQPNVLGNVE
jgi:hypothetical protein